MLAREMYVMDRLAKKLDGTRKPDGALLWPVVQKLGKQGGKGQALFTRDPKILNLAVRVLCFFPLFLCELTFPPTHPPTYPIYRWTIV